ncbi:MAG: histidine phosphatase family protein [Leptospira sp.]|nr:histidine phosphatase family protein [Leptospira sp.]
MKTIYLLRHSKSDWDSDFKTDKERGLAPRGFKAAERLAEYMDDYGFQVDLCLTSPATRCTVSLEVIRKKIDFASDYREEESIYEADLDTLLETIKSTPSSVSSLCLIGHNPGLEELSEYLILGESLEELHNPLFAKFPTSALLGISLSVENWRDISPGHGSIVVYWIPGRKGR